MNSMSSGDGCPAGVLLDSVGDIVASLPYLLGFASTDSLVAVAMQPGDSASGPRQSLARTLRVDLPAPEFYADAASALAVPLLKLSPLELVLVVVSGRDTSDLPYRSLIDECGSAFGAIGMPVVHAVWTPATKAGALWRCYDDPHCTGTVPDFGTSPLAAYAVLAGAVTYPSRDDMLAELAPDAEADLIRRAELLKALAAEHRPSQTGSYMGFRELVRAVLAANRGVLPSSDEDAMRLILALRDADTRDACLTLSEGETSVEAERLWRYLMRVTPGQDRAEPTTLLAITAYLRGDSVTAGMTARQAQAADSEHRLAAVVSRLIAEGIPASEVRGAIHESSRGALKRVMKRGPADG